MKRKILYFVIMLTVPGLFTMQSCKKEAPVKQTLLVAAMPAAPVPSADAIIPFTGSGQTINLAWEGSATNPIKWNVYFGKTSAPHLVASAVTGNAYSTTITKGGLFYWQVVTTDDNGVTTRSPVWSFDVNSNPAVPSGPIPATNAIAVSRTARLNWIASDPEGDDLTYDVFLGKTAIPTTVVATGITDTTYAVTKPLTTATDYYWKVVANDPYGGTSVSPVWKFTTGIAITEFEGDYKADEPAEAYSYGVTFTMVTPTTISTDNYWNSGWEAIFTLDLTQKTYSMTSFTFDTGWTGVESGIINTTTGTMTGTYTLKLNGVIQEQGVHTYTKL